MLVRRAIFVSALLAGCSMTSTGEATAGSDAVDALGSSERVCIDIDSIVATQDPKLVGPDADQPVFNVRSGEIVARNFALVVAGWSTFNDGVAKIYWVPVDREVAMVNALEITVEPLDGTGEAVTQAFGGDGTFSLAADGGAFWASGTRFTQPGRHRLTAVAPEHWGCFEVTV